MIGFSDILVVIGLLAVRVGIPIAVMALLVYLFKRLDRRWEQEARAQQDQQPAAGAAVARPTVRPSGGRDLPGIQMPFDPSRPVPVGLVAAPRQPCWDIKGCSKTQYQQCAAYQNPDMLCWQARLKVDGKIPEACPSCEIFQRYPTM